MVSNKSRQPYACLRIDAGGAAVIAVLSIICYFAFLKPMLEARDNRVLEQAAVAAQRDRLSEASAEVAALKRGLEQLERIATANPVQLLPATLSNQRLAELTELATSNGLNVDAVKTEHSIVDARFEIIPIHLAGTGSFQSCTAFLRKVRKQFADTGISVIELADNSSDPMARTSFVFNFTWYAAPGQTAAAKSS